MTPQELLSDLETREVSLAVRGEQLRIEAPHSVLTKELRRTLSECKAELVRLIRDNKPSEQTPSERGCDPDTSSVPTPEDVEAMSLRDFAQAGLILRLGTAEEVGRGCAGGGSVTRPARRG